MGATGILATPARQRRVLFVGSDCPSPRPFDEGSVERAVILHCRNPKDLLSLLLTDREASWLLVGPGLDDHTIEQLYWQAKLERPALQLAILGRIGDWRRAEQWIRRGCALYLAASASGRRILESMHLAEALGVRVIDSVFHERLGTSPGVGPSPLTRREKEVVKLVERGLRNVEIAASLHISENTVEFHLRHILQKLGVRNRTEAVRTAQLMGIT